MRGLDVFQGVLTIVVDGAGQIVRAEAPEIVPHVDLDDKPVRAPSQAVASALRLLGTQETGPPEMLAAGENGRVIFRNPYRDGYAPVAASLTIFPVGPASARLAYRLYIEKDRRHGFEMVLDANDGSLLFRQNLYHQAGTARVWRESPIKGPREVVTFGDGWLPDGAAVTTGNNADAYLDTDSDDEPDPYTLPDIQNGRAFSPAQTFDFPAGEGSTKQDPSQFPAASVTNLFYFVNVAHDYFYGLGFDEASGNFQADNFGRGGKGNDAIRAEGQDYMAGAGGFLTAPDGLPSRMEVGLIEGDSYRSTDFYDAAYDGQVVVHEYAHGVADRLVAGPEEVSCLLSGGFQSLALGEGWADYFGISFFDNPVLGAYAGRDLERGFRRHSYEGYAIAFEDFVNEGFDPHNDGEIWAATLWDLRKALGPAVTDRLVIDGMKSCGCRPTFVRARDAILAADRAANADANRQKIWETFAKHGLGYSATTTDGKAGSRMVFNAAYNLPPDLQPGNYTPAVLSQPPLGASLGALYVYQLTASDGDGDLLHYELTEGPAGMTVNPSTGRLEWTASFTGQRVKVTVTDGKGGKVVHGFYIPVLTMLSAGVPVTIDAKRDTVGIAVLTVPSGKQVMQTTLRGGSGDPDLMLLDPSYEDYGYSMTLGTAETLSVASPMPGFWAVYVYGVEDYSGVTLWAGYPVPETLPVNGTKANLSGEKTSETFYKVVVPPGAGKLRVTTAGGSGDVDLYARRGQVAVCSGWWAPCDVDEMSEQIGNAEEIGIPAPVPGDWFITVRGFRAYADLTLTTAVTGPEFTADGIVNSASFSKLLVPGGIFSIFGTGLAYSELAGGAIPLPTLLGSTSVKVNGTAAPLFYVSPTQVNAQMPYEVQPGEASVEVTLDQVTSSLVKVAVGTAGPAIFQYGTNRAVAQNEDGSLNEASRPAKAGSFVTAYLTGIGAVDNPVATGAAAAISPLSRSTSAFAASIGGKNAEVHFLGLVPGMVGLAQANILVPALPSGDYPLQMTVGGVVSSTALVAVLENR